MESLSPVKHLLTKFSHSSSILIFFGTFTDGQLLMQKLCHETKQAWETNMDAYRTRLTKSRKILKTPKGFNSELGEYLLEGSRYNSYKLFVHIYNQSDLIAFTKFINQVSQPHLLRNISNF